MINSTAEFHAVIGMAVTAAIKEVLERAHKHLQLIIQRDVYGAYQPVDYHRSDALLKAWRKQVSTLDGSMWFDSGLLAGDGGAWQHHSEMPGYGSLGQELLNKIEEGYRGYNAKTGREIPSRPMWQNFMRDMEKNIDKWVRAALRRQGLPVI